MLADNDEFGVAVLLLDDGLLGGVAVTDSGKRAIAPRIVGVSEREHPALGNTMALVTICRDGVLRDLGVPTLVLVRGADGMEELDVGQLAESKAEFDQPTRRLREVDSYEQPAVGLFRLSPHDKNRPLAPAQYALHRLTREERPHTRCRGHAPDQEISAARFRENVLDGVGNLVG